MCNECEGNTQQKKTASGWCLNPWIVLYFSLLEHECCCCCCVDVSVVHRIYYGWIVTQYYGCYGFCVACSWYGKPMTSMIPIQTSQFRTHYIYSTTVCVRRFVWNCVYYKCCYVLCAALACARNASMTRERERSKKKKIQIHSRIFTFDFSFSHATPLALRRAARAFIPHNLTPTVIVRCVGGKKRVVAREKSYG